MSSLAAHRVSCAPAAQPVFPDEILEEIFLRLDAAEDLARASAACTAFHRVVSARRFLRRFRCLHPTPALGLLEFGFRGAFQFHPAQPPHRSAPAARAFARAADFTFSFLGNGNPDHWRFFDARDGRVLLCRLVLAKVTLMVCDPLHRRQVQLPAIPGDPLSAAQDFQEFDSFLDPATNTEKEKQDCSFRVIFAVKNQHNLVTFHFSSATGKWRGITFNIPVPLGPYDRFHSFGRYYAHGCFFWSIDNVSSFVVMLNMYDMKLSVVDLPPGMHGHNPRARAIVEAGEGTIGLFTISDDMLQLYCKSLQGTEWHHERITPLPKLNSYWIIPNAAAGYLLLQAMPRGNLPLAMRESQYFTLNLKTFLVEGLCVWNSYFNGTHLYASFLLPFSQPSI